MKGLASDLFVLPDSNGQAVTLLLGSLGSLAGTAAVPWESPRALELALRSIDEALAQGHVLWPASVTQGGDRVVCDARSGPRRALPGAPGARGQRSTSTTIFPK
ncbi:MAG: hypothetical protein AAFU73_06095 [Planctomycetota bacterium]